MLLFFLLKDFVVKDDIVLLCFWDLVLFGLYVNNIELNVEDDFLLDGEDCFV